MKNIFLILCLFLFLNANAQTFDFNKVGDENSNKILKNFVLEKDPNSKASVVSYFCDVDNDGKKEVVGIIKSQFAYSLAGYKLFVLKENNGKWENFKTDVYFDIAQKFEIENKKVTYHKTIFYKNEKCKAKVKKDKIETTGLFLDCFKDKKAHNIEEITKFHEPIEHNDFVIEDFHSQSQRSVNINYVNLNEKTKHYLDLK